MGLEQHRKHSGDYLEQKGRSLPIPVGKFHSDWGLDLGGMHERKHRLWGNGNLCSVAAQPSVLSWFIWKSAASAYFLTFPSILSMFSLVTSKYLHCCGLPSSWSMVGGENLCKFNTGICMNPFSFLRGAGPCCSCLFSDAGLQTSQSRLC